MSGPTERSELLVVLDNNPAAWKMVATWPNVQLLGETVLVDNEAGRRAMVKRWAALSGLTREEVRRLWPTLHENGICRMDGTVDDSARRYVVAVVAAVLRPRS